MGVAYRPEQVARLIEMVMAGAQEEAPGGGENLTRWSKRWRDRPRRKTTFAPGAHFPAADGRERKNPMGLQKGQAPHTRSSVQGRARLMSALVLVFYWSHQPRPRTFQTVLSDVCFALAYLPLIAKNLKIARSVFNVFFFLCGFVPGFYYIFNIRGSKGSTAPSGVTGDIVAAHADSVIIALVYQKYGLAMPLIASIFI